MKNESWWRGCNVCWMTTIRVHVRRFFLLNLKLDLSHKFIAAVEKLPTDDLCKICMDAPIECVLLECGHCCSCTNCGKVLSECPLCRQYIIRVVRLFRS